MARPFNKSLEAVKAFSAEAKKSGISDGGLALMVSSMGMIGLVDATPMSDELFVAWSQVADMRTTAELLYILSHEPNLNKHALIRALDKAQRVLDDDDDNDPRF